MVMKIKRKGAVTNSKEGICKVGNKNYLYVKTTGILSQKRIDAEVKHAEKNKIPKKTRTLNGADKENMEKLTGSTLQKVIQELDATSKEYKTYTENSLMFTFLLPKAVNIDGSIKGYELEDGTECTVWEYLEVTKGDYCALTEYLLADDGMAMREADIVLFGEELDRLSSGEPTYASAELQALELAGKEDEVNADNI